MRQAIHLWLSLWWLVIAVALLQWGLSHWQLTTLGLAVDELHRGPIIATPDDFLEKALEMMHRRPSVPAVFTFILRSTFFAAIVTSLFFPLFVSAYAAVTLRDEATPQAPPPQLISDALARSARDFPPTLVQRLYIAVLQVPLLWGLSQILWPEPLLDAMATTALFALLWLWSLLWIAAEHTRCIVVAGADRPYHPKHCLRGLAELVREPRFTAMAWMLWFAQLLWGLYPVMQESKGQLSLDNPWIHLLTLLGLAALATLRYLLLQVLHSERNSKFARA